MGGLRWGRFFGTSQAYAGLGGYYGSPTGSSPATENLYYGGATLGYDGKLSKVFVFEIGILVGYGQGEIKSLGLKQLSYFVVEPSLGAGFALGGGWRITLSTSYLHMTNASTFSGPTFGFRIDNKTQTQVKDIND